MQFERAWMDRLSVEVMGLSRSLRSSQVNSSPSRQALNEAELIIFQRLIKWSEEMLDPSVRVSVSYEVESASWGRMLREALATPNPMAMRTLLDRIMRQITTLKALPRAEVIDRQLKEWMTRLSSLDQWLSPHRVTTLAPY